MQNADVLLFLESVAHNSSPIRLIFFSMCICQFHNTHEGCMHYATRNKLYSQGYWMWELFVLWFCWYVWITDTLITSSISMETVTSSQTVNTYYTRSISTGDRTSQIKVGSIWTYYKKHNRSYRKNSYQSVNCLLL